MGYRCSPSHVRMYKPLSVLRHAQVRRLTESSPHTRGDPPIAGDGFGQRASAQAEARIRPRSREDRRLLSPEQLWAESGARLSCGDAWWRDPRCVRVSQGQGHALDGDRVILH